MSAEIAHISPKHEHLPGAPNSSTQPMALKNTHENKEAMDTVFEQQSREEEDAPSDTGSATSKGPAGPTAGNYRRRCKRELIRAFPCLETDCTHRYEAWRSLQAHYRMTHDQKRRKQEYIREFLSLYHCGQLNEGLVDALELLASQLDIKLVPAPSARQSPSRTSSAQNPNTNTSSKSLGGPGRTQDHDVLSWRSESGAEGENASPLPNVARDANIDELPKSPLRPLTLASSMPELSSHSITSNSQLNFPVSSFSSPSKYGFHSNDSVRDFGIPLNDSDFSMDCNMNIATTTAQIVHLLTTATTGNTSVLGDSSSNVQTVRSMSGPVPSLLDVEDEARRFSEVFSNQSPASMGSYEDLTNRRSDYLRSTTSWMSGSPVNTSRQPTHGHGIRSESEIVSWVRTHHRTESGHHVESGWGNSGPALPLHSSKIGATHSFSHRHSIDSTRPYDISPAHHHRSRPESEIERRHSRRPMYQRNSSPDNYLGDYGRSQGERGNMYLSAIGERQYSSYEYLPHSELRFLHSRETEPWNTRSERGYVHGVIPTGSYSKRFNVSAAGGRPVHVPELEPETVQRVLAETESQAIYSPTFP